MRGPLFLRRILYFGANKTESLWCSMSIIRQVNLLRHLEVLCSFSILDPQAPLYQNWHWRESQRTAKYRLILLGKYLSKSMEGRFWLELVRTLTMIQMFWEWTISLRTISSFQWNSTQITEEKASSTWNLALQLTQLRQRRRPKNKKARNKPRNRNDKLTLNNLNIINFIRTPSFCCQS